MCVCVCVCVCVYFTVSLLDAAFEFIFLLSSTLRVIARNTQLTCRDNDTCLYAI